MSLAPQLLLVGAQKAATTSIFDLYGNLGMVCGTNYRLRPGHGFSKEAHFFDLAYDVFDQYSVDDYTRMYDNASCPIFMDATPNYLFTGISSYRMSVSMSAAWKSAVRILIILRDPTMRDLSVYNMAKKDWWEDRSGTVASGATKVGDTAQNFCSEATLDAFPTYESGAICKIADWKTRCLGYSSDLETAWAYCAEWAVEPETVASVAGYVSEPLTTSRIHNRLVNSMYAYQVKQYAKYFHRRQTMVVAFEHLLDEQPKYLELITRFYGLDYYNHASVLQQLPATNEDEYPGKVKTIPCGTRNTLARLYEPLNAALYEFINSTQSSKPDSEPPLSETLIGMSWPGPECTGDHETFWGDDDGGARSHRTSGRSKKGDTGAPLVPSPAPSR